MKISTYILFLILSFNLYSQKNVSLDSIDVDIEEYDIENFKDVYIKEFSFHYPTFNPELGMDKFLPTSENIHYERRKLNGNIKKLTKFVKYSGRNEKQFRSNSLYNEMGLKLQSDESSNIKNFFYYDSNNRLSKKIRIVNNDTIKQNHYSYNEKNQLVKHNNFVIEYDELQRPFYVKDMKYYPKGIEYKISYNNNIVEVEEFYNGKSFGKKKYTYSKSYNLLKKETYSGIYYYTYDKMGQLIKEVSFKNDKLQRVRSYKYDENGNEIYQSFQFAKDLKDGTKPKQISKYKYDKFKNIIHEHTSSEFMKSTYEYFYEIKYY